MDNAASHLMLRSGADPSVFVFDFPGKMALKLDPFLTHDQTQKSTPADPSDSGSPRHNPGAPMDKSTLRVYLATGSFNVVKFGDATDIKVGRFKASVNHSVQYVVAFLTSFKIKIVNLKVQAM